MKSKVGIDPGKFEVRNEKGELLSPENYFVLRRGDILAIATLRSYAANAMTLLDLKDLKMIPMTEVQYDHLLQLADGVSDLARQWEDDADLKLPDN